MLFRSLTRARTRPESSHYPLQPQYKTIRFDRLALFGAGTKGLAVLAPKPAMAATSAPDLKNPRRLCISALLPLWPKRPFGRSQPSRTIVVAKTVAPRSDGCTQSKQLLLVVLGCQYFFFTKCFPSFIGAPSVAGSQLQGTRRGRGWRFVCPAKASILCASMMRNTMAGPSIAIACASALLTLTSPCGWCLRALIFAAA